MCLPDIFSLITKLQDVDYAIYLLIFLQTLEFVHFICKSFVSSSLKSFAFFIKFLFFDCSFSNNFALALCFSLFWWFAFLFFSLKSRSRQWRWWLTGFYHLISFHNLLFYQHFTNKMYIFLLSFVATVGNIKSQLTFHTIIIHPTEIFWKEGSVSVSISLCISFKVFLELREMFIVFNNKIINLLTDGLYSGTCF